MSFTFRPASEIRQGHGIFVALVGGTNSGKTYSALRLARGLAGDKRVAVLDTEGGRVLHLRDQFDFDVSMIPADSRPGVYADAAKAAEDAGYGCLVIDSFSMEWQGVLRMQEAVLMRAVDAAKAKAAEKGWSFNEGKALNAHKLSSWIEPKSEHKAMLYSMLERRIPIVFAIRGELSIDADTKKETFKAICDKRFPFEVTVSFRLSSERKGHIDLSQPDRWKMEGAHQQIFRDGEILCERHGELMRAWAAGELAEASPPAAAAPKRTVSLWTPTGPVACENATEWLTALEGWLKAGTDESAAIWTHNQPLADRIRAQAEKTEDARMLALLDAVRSLIPTE